MPSAVDRDSHCPLCQREGRVSKLRLFQLNFEEAVSLCEFPKCTYPMYNAPHLPVVVKCPLSSMPVLYVKPTSRRKTHARSPIKIKKSPLRTKQRINKFLNSKLKQNQSSHTATQSSVVEDDSSHPVSCLQWENRDALCWLDVLLCLFVHCKNIKNIAESENGILSQLLRDYDRAVLVSSTENWTNDDNDDRTAPILSFSKITSDLQNGCNLPAIDEADNTSNNSVNKEDNNTSTINGKLQVNNTLESSNIITNVDSIKTTAATGAGSPGSFDVQNRLLKCEGSRIMDAAREVVWNSLNPSLKCERGSNHSPVFAVPLLINDDDRVKEMFGVTYTSAFECSKCGLKKHKTLHEVMLTVSSPLTKFSPPVVKVTKPCPSCESPDQSQTISADRLPPCVLMHFVHGVPSSNVTTMDFTHTDQRYHVTAVIQYSNHPDHFIAWIRDVQSNLWMECDDMAGPECQYDRKQPDIPPSQVHMVLWECAMVPTNSPSLERLTLSAKSTFSEKSTVPMKPIIPVNPKNLTKSTILASSVPVTSTITSKSVVPVGIPANSTALSTSTVSAITVASEESKSTVSAKSVVSEDSKSTTETEFLTKSTLLAKSYHQSLLDTTTSCNLSTISTKHTHQLTVPLKNNDRTIIQFKPNKPAPSSTVTKDVVSDAFISLSMNHKIENSHLEKKRTAQAVNKMSTISHNGASLNDRDISNSSSKTDSQLNNISKNHSKTLKLNNGETSNDSSKTVFPVNNSVTKDVSSLKNGLQDVTKNYLSNGCATNLHHTAPASKDTVKNIHVTNGPKSNGLSTPKLNSVSKDGTVSKSLNNGSVNKDPLSLLTPEVKNVILSKAGGLNNINKNTKYTIIRKVNGKLVKTDGNITVKPNSSTNQVRLKVNANGSVLNDKPGLKSVHISDSINLKSASTPKDKIELSCDVKTIENAKSNGEIQKSNNIVLPNGNVSLHVSNKDNGPNVANNSTRADVNTPTPKTNVVKDFSKNKNKHYPIKSSDPPKEANLTNHNTPISSKQSSSVVAEKDYCLASEHAANKTNDTPPPNVHSLTKNKGDNVEKTKISQKKIKPCRPKTELNDRAITRYSLRIIDKPVKHVYNNKVALQATKERQASHNSPVKNTSIVSSDGPDPVISPTEPKPIVQESIPHHINSQILLMKFHRHTQQIKQQRWAQSGHQEPVKNETSMPANSVNAVNSVNPVNSVKSAKLVKSEAVNPLKSSMKKTVHKVPRSRCKFQSYVPKSDRVDDTVEAPKPESPNKRKVSNDDDVFKVPIAQPAKRTRRKSGVNADNSMAHTTVVGSGKSPTKSDGKSPSKSDGKSPNKSDRFNDVNMNDSPNTVATDVTNNNIPQTQSPISDSNVNNHLLNSVNNNCNISSDISSSNNSCIDMPVNIAQSVFNDNSDADDSFLDDLLTMSFSPSKKPKLPSNGSTTLIDMQQNLNTSTHSYVSTQNYVQNSMSENNKNSENDAMAENDILKDLYSALDIDTSSITGNNSVCDQFMDHLDSTLDSCFGLV